MLATGIPPRMCTKLLIWIVLAMGLPFAISRQAIPFTGAAALDIVRGG